MLIVVWFVLFHPGSVLTMSVSSHPVSLKLNRQECDEDISTLIRDNNKIAVYT